MKFESSKHETKLSMKLTEQVQARILNKTHREPANKPETTNKLKMKKTNDERWRKETDDKETPKTGDRRRQSKTSTTQQHMYLHSYEFLAAPPSVVRLRYLARRQIVAFPEPGSPSRCSAPYRVRRPESRRSLRSSSM